MSDDDLRAEVDRLRAENEALKSKDSDFYLMSTEGSPFIGLISKWSMNTLLDAKVEDFLDKQETKDNKE